MTQISTRYDDEKHTPMTPILNAAYVSFEEDIKGTLEVGKYADFAVLNKSLFEVELKKFLRERCIK